MTKDKKESDSLEKVHRDLVSNRPSSLVKRALDDLARLKAHPPSGLEHTMDILKKRQIRVVIGNVEKNVFDLFSAEIKEIIKDKYALTIKSVFYGEELLEIAENAEADIFIVIVSNILFRTSYSNQERIEQSLQLIKQIKKGSDKPMIVLYLPIKTKLMRPPFPYEIAEERVKQTGADFYLPFSADTTDFRTAFEKCIYEVLRRAN